MKVEVTENLTKKVFRPADLLLICACVLLFTLPIVLMRPSEGAFVKIYQNDRLVAEFPLDADTEYRYEHDGLYNVIVIRDGTVRVSEANCPDRTCTHFLPISKDGQTIVCLPSGLKLVISGGEAPDVDGETGGLFR